LQIPGVFHCALRFRYGGQGLRRAAIVSGDPTPAPPAGLVENVTARFDNPEMPGDIKNY
jgi:hypothetical protein